MINLFTSYYTAKNKQRNDELWACLMNNIANPLIDRVYLVSKDDLKLSKTTHIQGERLTYSEYFALINQYTGEGDINIVANSDIHFNDTLALAKSITENQCYALSRTNNYSSDSQDVWVFKGDIKPVEADFYLGLPGCDNRVAYELNKVGYEVTNPSKSIQAIHLHKSNFRTYSEAQRIKPPYLLLQPTELPKPFGQKKILHIALNQDRQPTLCDALASLGEYYEIDWIAKLNQLGAHGLKKHIIQEAQRIQPDITFMQIQGAGAIDAQTIKQIGGYKINWTGDVRRPTPRWYFDMARVVDLTLFTNQADIDDLRKLGYKADYLQIGFDHTVFNNENSGAEIVFMGNHNGATFPLSKFRYDMVHQLRDVYGERFKVYGGAWDFPTESLMHNLKAEAEVYRKCKIAINCSHFDLPKYTSDRMFRIMGAGAFCLSKHYPEIEKEFTDGENVVIWKDLKDLQEKINHYLANDKERQRIALNGYNHVHNTAKWEHRIEQLKELIK